MHIWLELLTREAAFLVVLSVLGAGPATYLSDRFDLASRIALAPALGFCVGTATTTTLVQFVAVNDSFWVVVVLAFASGVVAVRRTRRNSGADLRVRAADLLQIAVVCLAITVPLSSVLHHHHTAGPGVYTYTDVDNYVAIQDGIRTMSIGQAAKTWRAHVRSGTRFANLTQWATAVIADFGSNLDADPIEANVDALLGVDATDTFAPFLIVILLIGGLGAYAGVRTTTRSRTWAAVLAGGMFGGPLFLELWFDSYQAALCALALFIPLALIAGDALRGPSRTDLVLCALVLSAFLTVYPLFIPLIAAAVGLVLAWLGLLAWRAGTCLRTIVLGLALRLSGIAGLACVLEPVGFARDLGYVGKVLNNEFALPRVGYRLPVEVLPGWILQTREFWSMPTLATGDSKQLILAAVIPLCMLVLVAIAAVRHPPTRMLLALVVVSAAVAEYSFVSRQACTYCAERNLLPLAPVAAVMVAVGIHMLWSSGWRGSRHVALIGSLLVVVAVAQRARIELQRFSNGSYLLDSANRGVLAKLPRRGGAVQLEGYGSSYAAQGEEALVYHLVNERSHGRASVSLDANEFGGLAYLNFGVVVPPGPEFRPDYRYVLTRFGGIRSDRATIARSAGIALQRRTAQLDVTPISGLAVALERVDTGGVPFVEPQTPLRLKVVGARAAQAAWVLLSFSTQVPVTVPHQALVSSVSRPGRLTACVQARGESTNLFATLSLSFAPVAGAIPRGNFPPPVPPTGVTLTGMIARSIPCRL